MEIAVIVIVIIGHWLADYIFQTNESIVDKGKDFVNVIHHVSQYTTVMTALMVILIAFGVITTQSWFFIINFWIFTFAFHLLVDYFSSKLTLRIKTEEFKFGYFSIISTDQMVHIVSLFLTISYLFY